MTFSGPGDPKRVWEARFQVWDAKSDVFWSWEGHFWPQTGVPQRPSGTQSAFPSFATGRGRAKGSAE